MLFGDVCIISGNISQLILKSNVFTQFQPKIKLKFEIYQDNMSATRRAE